MKILFTNKINKNKVYLIINGKHRIKDKNILKFVEKFKFSTGEDFNIKTIDQVLENGKIEHNILVFIRNIKKFNEHLEEIIGKLGDIIIKSNEKFSLSFKKLGVDKKLQEYFVELLAHKLYKYNEFKKDKSKYSINIDANIDKDIIKNKIEAIYFARDLMNKPGSTLNPDTYENIIKETFKSNKNVDIKVIKGKELEKIGAGGIYNVGKGSIYDPRMIILKYTVKKGEKYNALIGKGVTFDTGGYNLKPTNYIEEMYLDMGGSAVVLGTFKHLVETGYKKNLICALGIVENKVSSKSYLPSDIIKTYNGKTVKVGNTDAEGRLVLADVLSYVEKNYKIDYIFDFATLTGAAIIALGHDIGVIMGKNEKLLKNIQNIGWENKERVWELPLYNGYKKLLKTKNADLNNIGGQQAGTITGGLFLSEFIKNKNWVHFDIAGPCIMKNHSIYGTGGSGFGIRLAIEILNNI